MRSLLRTCAFLAAVSAVAGCRVEVSQSNVGRIVRTVLSSRRSSPSYNMDIQVWNGSGESPEAVGGTIEKDQANTYLYSFGDGTRYWSTPDGCVVQGPGRGQTEMFSGLPEPTEAELHDALSWGASRYITRHEIVADLFTSEGAWKGHRATVTPRHPGPFDARGEQFVDRRSRAKVVSVEYDERGNVVRKRLAKSVTIMARGEFSVPQVSDRDVVRLAPGQECFPAPKWARSPEPVIEVLSRPRQRHSDGLAVYDMSKGGFVFVLFEREASGPAITSPIAHTADLGGVRVSAWPIGEKFLYRWRDGGIEFSLLGNLPPDVAWDFLVANVGPRS